MREVFRQRTVGI